ncbi:hypothetical protein SERLA73DRAFT_150330 [Serpula lacrymans var. lacrymans S7.3]|uniref:Uncharacterized protein n=1 Tax=Serpula lacrymans var. lacrymans (strain S7.3) TaxID=936435 RepID=F8PM40_SERL3|nr:hypothetical protein SERLA73DRAFT_150330 [Serpula lacrymans var. lacrymans S7.3]
MDALKLLCAISSIGEQRKKAGRLRGSSSCNQQTVGIICEQINTIPQTFGHIANNFAAHSAQYPAKVKTCNDNQYFEVFEWIESKIEHCLPEEYSILVKISVRTLLYHVETLCLSNYLRDSSDYTELPPLAYAQASQVNLSYRYRDVGGDCFSPENGMCGISKDVKDNQKMFQSLKVIFEELFNWIYGIMQTHLPEKCQMFEQIASILPGNHNSPASPFLSLVININIQTKAHHDSKDQEFCLVLPIGKFRGTALLIVETGLLMKAMADDVIGRSP